MQIEDAGYCFVIEAMLDCKYQVHSVDPNTFVIDLSDIVKVTLIRRKEWMCFIYTDDPENIRCEKTVGRLFDVVTAISKEIALLKLENLVQS